MRRIRVAIAIACFAAHAGHGLAQAPSKGEQAAALDAVREYALSYTKRLPNYTCTQTYRQTIAIHNFKLTESKEFDCGTKQNTWFASPAIAIAEGARGSVPGASPPVAEGKSSRAEFGTLLDTIFDPQTGADLRWDSQAARNGRTLYVFAFRVPQSRGYSLVESGRTIQVPFRGFVYADYETRAVVRIEMKCIDIPGDSEYTGVDVTLDYKPARMAGQEFIVPAHYLAHFHLVRGEVTNEAGFTAYSRFSADSTLKFEDDDVQ
jgi:hypothetical protein